jgi:integrase
MANNVTIREKLLSDGRVSLILDYRLNGQRIKQTLKIYVNPKDAKSRDSILRNAYEEAYRSAMLLKSQVEIQLLNQDHDIPTRYDKCASFVDYFNRLAEPRNYNWQSVAKHLHRFTKGQLPFGNVTEEWLSRFQNYLRTRIQDVTVCSYMGIIITALNQAVREKLIRANPILNVRRVRGEEKPPKYLTKEQVQHLLENRQGIPDWFVEAFLFSCYTGLRLSDVEALEWGDIQPCGTSVDQAKQLMVIKRQIKTKTEVRVPLSPQAHQIIKNILEPQEPGPIAESLVFSLKSRSQSKRYIERWRKQAGVHFTYHSSRHTFGTGLQSAGVDINTTSKLMGHKSLGMTLRYAKVVDKTRNEAIDKMAAYWG